MAERTIKRTLLGIGVAAVAAAMVLASLGAWEAFLRVQRAEQLSENGHRSALQADVAQTMSVTGEPYPGEAGVDDDAVTYRNLLPWIGELQVVVESAKLAHSYGELGADSSVVTPVDPGYMIVELAVRVRNVDAMPKQESSTGHAWFLITDFSLYVDGQPCGDPVGFDGTPHDANPLTESWYFDLEPGEEALYHVYYAIDDSLCTTDSVWTFAIGDYGRASEESAFSMGSASVSLGGLVSDGRV